jgi:probable rRNA maturation factor
MTVVLDIQLEAESPEGIENKLKAAADSVLKNENVKSGSITILLTDNRTMRSLNRQFRSENKTTDVLSFYFGEDPGILSNQPIYIGDIAISVPYARRQAESQGHSVTAEIQLLAIHGILHLLGYDHETEDTKEEMWAVQRKVLDQLNLAHVEPTESN